jgi:3'-phosphoadenosine 5'-phosphosulfate sulfotransferase (PAPS reductase)/FAD synthetase
MCVGFRFYEGAQFDHHTPVRRKENVVSTQNIAGISGGRTSALMALRYLPPETVMTFQNTGKEHPETLEFLRRVEDDLGRPIVRLEFRAPPRGEKPSNATFEAVTHERLSRKGEPFIDYLLCAKSYRAKEKGKGPIAPWARQRVCTAYLKIKTQRKYIESLGWEDPTIFVGLRADEQDRIALMRERNEKRDAGERAPLNEAGITKGDVLRFWATKPYDLGIPEHLGNCTGCFLKNESDLATALLDPNTDAQWWVGIERDYAPMRRNRSSYAQVLAEAPERMRIRAALATGGVPWSALPIRRHELVLKQERERMAAGSRSFSCHCEGAEKMDDQLLLDLEAA